MFARYLLDSTGTFIRTMKPLSSFACPSPPPHFSFFASLLSLSFLFLPLLSLALPFPITFFSLCSFPPPFLPSPLLPLFPPIFLCFSSPSPLLPFLLLSSYALPSLPLPLIPLSQLLSFSLSSLALPPFPSLFFLCFSSLPFSFPPCLSSSPPCILLPPSLFCLPYFILFYKFAIIKYIK